ncbi:MAG: putative quinol monooxygenase [Cyclobacteriaceae bacterium]
MLIRIVHMTFQPDKVPEFLALFEASKPMVRHFTGCHHLELWQDQNDENKFMTYSHWDSEAALNRYRDSELFAGIWKQTKALFSDKPRAYSLESVA